MNENKSLTNRGFLELVLNDIEYQVNENNMKIVETILLSGKNDMLYVWDKIPALKEKLSHIKGYIAMSNTNGKFKVKYDRESVSEEISKEFYDIVSTWKDKYKISMDFDYEKEVFYIN